MATTTSNDKPATYTAEQEQIIRDAIAANDGVADKALAESLAADERMNDRRDGKNEPRKGRAIIAKMTRMEGVTYTKQTPVSKTGKPVQHKRDMVARIAKLVNVSEEKLSGMDAAPKLALETLVEALAA